MMKGNVGPLVPLGTSNKRHSHHSYSARSTDPFSRSGLKAIVGGGALENDCNTIPVEAQVRLTGYFFDSNQL